MENRRFILLAVLGVLIFFVYQAWKTEHAPQVLEAQQETPMVSPPDTPATAASQAEARSKAGEVPTIGVPETAGPAAVATAAPKRLIIRTDLYEGEIALVGGDLRRLELIGYPVSKKNPKQSIPLLNDRDGKLFVLQSGVAGSDRAIGSHLDTFTAIQPASTLNEYRLADGSDVLEVPLEHIDSAGNRVLKTYRFKRGSYEFEVEQRVTNAGTAPLAASAYLRLVRTPIAAGEEPPFVHTFMGLGIYERKPESGSYRFKKLAFDKLDDNVYNVEQQGGWISMLQHYFVAAILPPADEKHRFEAKPGKDRGYVAQYQGPVTTIAPQAEQVFTTRLYVGPKLQDSISSAAKGLELTVDYGILTAISEPLFWLLEKLHQYTGNWGVAIILLTLIVKGSFYKLSEKQYRSTAKMRKFAPRIAELKERYAGDRERMSKAMMELYKKEGFNPLAGCWPLLIQMPVFFALYWVFVESVELRQADFMLWINDLTAPDPFYVLPVIYGVSMFAMQRLSGQNMTLDPMQQKVMNVMPIALTGFFAFFPSGLVLYWCVSNLISIAQQWYITRKLDKEGLSTKPAKLAK